MHGGDFDYGYKKMQEEHDKKVEEENHNAWEASRKGLEVDNFPQAVKNLKNGRKRH